MDTAIARKRLEEIRSELDRSISVLKGEHPDDERILDYPQDPADAGANLSESERTEAVLAAAKTAALRGARRPAPHRAWHVRDLRRLRRRGTGRPARGQAADGALRDMPGQVGPAAALSARRAARLE